MLRGSAPPQQAYAPHPPTQGYPSYAPPPPQQGYYGQPPPYPQQPQQPYGYGAPPPCPQQYQQMPYQGHPMVQGFGGGYGRQVNRGWFGSGMSTIFWIRIAAIGFFIALSGFGACISAISNN